MNGTCRLSPGWDPILVGPLDSSQIAMDEVGFIGLTLCLLERYWANKYPCDKSDRRCASDAARLLALLLGVEGRLCLSC